MQYSHGSAYDVFCLHQQKEARLKKVRETIDKEVNEEKQKARLNKESAVK